MRTSRRRMTIMYVQYVLGMIILAMNHDAPQPYNQSNKWRALTLNYGRCTDYHVPKLGGVYLGRYTFMYHICRMGLFWAYHTDMHLNM